MICILDEVAYWPGELASPRLIGAYTRAAQKHDAAYHALYRFMRPRRAMKKRRAKYWLAQSLRLAEKREAMARRFHVDAERAREIEDLVCVKIGIPKFPTGALRAS